MKPVAPFKLEIISGKGQRFGQRLIRQRPIAVGIVQIVRAVLKKDADRFLLRLADQKRIDVAAANVGKASNQADDFAELIGSVPGNREGGDRS